MVLCFLICFQLENHESEGQLSFFDLEEKEDVENDDRNRSNQK